MSINISLCMIVKNEEINLPNCLESVKDIADEINIVDTGSSDKTIEIARRYTDRIYHFDWINDFAAARNFSFTKATRDYILWLDADDIITPDNRMKFIRLKEMLDKNTDYVLMPYHYAHDESGNVTVILTRERLVKRTTGFIWGGAVHETLNLSGNGITSDIYIKHGHNRDAEASSKRNMQILEKTIESGEYTKRDLYYYSTALYHFERYDDALGYFKRFFAEPEQMLTIGTEAYLCAHRIYLMKGDNEAALNLLLNNEELLGDKSEVYCALGDFYRNVANKPDKACEYYYKALKCKGNDRPGIFIERKESYYYFVPLSLLGGVFFSVGMYKEALTYFEKSLAYKPNHEKTLAIVEKLRALLRG